MSAPESLAGDREQRVLAIIETARAKPARFRDARITLAHGAGGKATQTLIEGLLVPAFARPDGALAALGDAGAVAAGGVALAISSDSFGVKPLRTPLADRADIRTPFALRTRLSRVRPVQEGEFVSYDESWRAPATSQPRQPQPLRKTSSNPVGRVQAKLATALTAGGPQLAAAQWEEF